MLHAYAEEQAMEDAIYYMGEALRKGVIDLDAFLKVRGHSSPGAVLESRAKAL